LAAAYNCSRAAADWESFRVCEGEEEETDVGGEAVVETGFAGGNLEYIGRACPAGRGVTELKLLSLMMEALDFASGVSD
jgi:hypothetical protein